MSFIDDYIKKCDSYIQKTKKEKETLIEEIVSVFSPEIENIEAQLDMFSPHSFVNTQPDVPYDLDGDLSKLKAKLIWFSEKAFFSNALNAAPLISIVQQNDNRVNLSVNLQFTIKQIQELAKNDVLSEEDKAILVGKLTEIEFEQNEGAKKAELWRKVGDVLKWLADKSVQVGIAALPYIIAALQNAPQ